MVKPQALIFDLDETLLDGSGLRRAIARTCELMAARRPELEAARLIAANGKVWQRYWPEVEERWKLGAIEGAAASFEGWRRALQACGCGDEAAARDALQTHLRLARGEHRLFADAAELLAAAAEIGLPLALITNGARDTQREKLEVLGIENRFSAIVVSAEVGMAKPDPAIFEVALGRLGIGRDRAWHVGDSLKADVAGAKAAGVGAVWLNRSGAVRAAGDPAPDLEVSSLSGLLSVLGFEP